MAQVAIIGTGLIPCGKHIDRTIVDMGAEVSLLALQDAGIKPSMVEAGFFGNILGGRLFSDFTIGQHVFWEVGIHKVPILNIENACTSGSSGIYLAYNMIAAGQIEMAIVTGVEKMIVPEMGLVDSGRSEPDTLMGLVAPATFGIRARRHMEEFGTTAEQLAMVSVKNRSIIRMPNSRNPSP